MSKYQILATRPDAPDFTLLEMDSPTFLEEKRQLLEQGLEVVGDIIHAATREEAIAHHRGGFGYLSREYSAATPAGGAAWMVMGLVDEMKKRLTR